MEISKPFNPLAKLNLARTIGGVLLSQPPSKFPPDRFYGAGVYLLYYMGAFPLYRPITEANLGGKCLQPIYVGKAVPPGTRKGDKGLDIEHGNAIYDRLKKHAQSIGATDNLKVADFLCRWLHLDEVFITLGETMLISHFKPLWNVVLDGFGNNPPGKGRAAMQRPRWHILHPGGNWASALAETRAKKEIEATVKEHFRTTPVPPSELKLLT